MYPLVWFFGGFMIGICLWVIGRRRWQISRKKLLQQKNQLSQEKKIAVEFMHNLAEAIGEGVERTFPLYGTLIDTIKVIRSGKVRRAKLYYLRDRTGKSARIAEKIRKKIGIDIDAKPETVTEENLAPVTKESETEAKTDKAPAVEAKIEEAPKAETKIEKKLENTPEKK